MRLAINSPNQNRPLLNVSQLSSISYAHESRCMSIHTVNSAEVWCTVNLVQEPGPGVTIMSD